MVYSLQEQKGQKAGFSQTLERLNSLLDTVEIHKTEGSLKLRNKVTHEPRDAGTLSSGESEALSLAIEVLYFENLSRQESNRFKLKLLLLDEPDVHLHPDLQQRLMHLISNTAALTDIHVVIATHSTPLLSAIADNGGRVCFLKKQDRKLQFIQISNALKEILPIFGAHPLTNVFNSSPILLVEGPDDNQVWQRAIRSSNGRIRLYPCHAGDVQSLKEYEATCQSVIDSVYDNGIAYSLRDGDGTTGAMQHLENVGKYRLNCYAIENLLLTDDVLAFIGTNWDSLKQEIQKWVKDNQEHPCAASVQEFASDFDRRNRKIKDFTNILLVLAGSKKPWDVVIGQSIASLDSASLRTDGSLVDYLGSDFVDALGLCN
jgi:energy-coupling factor transporter ATP-binding protein EcfA2